MIATDRFIYIHQPKTGGTFVTTVLMTLQRLLGTRELYVRHPSSWLRKLPRKHGTCRDIPRSQRRKLVLTTMRNPYDLYVSQFKFGWWKRPEYSKYYRFTSPFHFSKQYPEYPELSFEQFVRLFNCAFCAHPRNRDFDSSQGLGVLTEHFMRFYFKHPWRRLFTMDDAYLKSGRIRKDLFDVHFLRTDRLNQQLYDYLLGLGYAAEDLEFILKLGKIVLPGSTRGPN